MLCVGCIVQKMPGASRHHHHAKNMRGVWAPRTYSYLGPRQLTSTSKDGTHHIREA